MVPKKYEIDISLYGIVLCRGTKTLKGCSKRTKPDPTESQPGHNN